MRANTLLQPTANGSLPLGLHFILAKSHQAAGCG
jgi:hypothetical protein